MSVRSRSWFRDGGDPRGARARAKAAETEAARQAAATLRNCDPWRGEIGTWVRPGFNGFLDTRRTR